ncbi:MAG: hypothetical protein K9K79_11290, partial [Desulfohalobiaceae bacterium]|nr:hypothetical protein [Desulfohalobiaceae bacterium]
MPLPSGLTNNGRSGLPTGLTGADRAGSWQNIQAQPSLLDQMQRIVDLQQNQQWIEPGTYTHVANQAGIDPGNWQAFQQAAQVGSLLDQIVGGGQGGGQGGEGNNLTRDEFDMGMDGGPEGNPSNVGPTPEGTGFSPFGQAFSDALEGLMDPNSLAYRGLKALTPPPINLILAIRGLMEGGNQGDPSMAPDPTVGLNAPPNIGPGISGNVGNLGQGISGTGAPSGIGPLGISGADDADVAQGIADGLNGAAGGG